MTSAFGVAGLGVYVTRRFLEDSRVLQPAQVRNVQEAIGRIRTQGLYTSGLLTEKVNGNPDGRFRFLRVDLQYRMVAAVEGREILLLKVGNHDETESWGTTATLREYEERMDAAEAAIGPRMRARRIAEPGLLDVGMSVGEIATSPELSDAIVPIDDSVLDGWVDGTIEDWMVFLSPVQRRAVDRAVSGPGRVTGGPGTGKTVVALHRAAQFAREATAPGSILLTSFVNNIPPVLSGLFERLAPEAADRIDARTVHSLVLAELQRSGLKGQVDFDGRQADARFDRVWAADKDRAQRFKDARITPSYLRTEIERVIEGRGIATREQYLAVERHGRRRALGADLRALVWDLYTDYRAACANPAEPVIPWERGVNLALGSLRERPPERRYGAIVVDEAQDITESGLRLLLAHLDGGARGRILLVGDAGQRIYQGGWRLADLGLEIRGRSFALDLCYRSTDEIMRAVGALGATLSTEEFGEDGLRSLATSTVRSGPRPRMRSFPSAEEEAAWVISELDPDDPEIDGVAILVPENRQVAEWRERLKGAGIGSIELREYAGRPVPGVKVGTYHRGKGLEFARVYLPSVNSSFPRIDREDADSWLASGALLYVAMSRARDRLAISSVGRPSGFLDQVRAFCDEGEG